MDHPSRICLGSVDSALADSPVFSFSDLLHERSRGDFLSENVSKPMWNTLVLQPYNTVANIINEPCRVILHTTVMPKVDAFEVVPAEFGSSAWLAQNLSYGVSAGFVFGMASKGTRLLAGRCGLKLSHASSTIISGGILEGARDLRPGETHAGNFVSGVAMMGTFEAGNYYCRGLSGWRLHLARAGVGASAAYVHSSAAALVTGRSATEHLREELLTGAIMNVVIPVVARPVTGEGKRMASNTSGGAVHVEVPLECESRTSLARPERGSVVLEGCERVYVEEGLSEPGTFSDWSDYCQQAVGKGRIPMQRFRSSEFPQVKILVEQDANAEQAAVSAVELLRGVPDVSLICEVRVLDRTHRLEPWLRQQSGNDSLRLYGEAERGGKITFYRPSFDGETVRTSLHEWNHLLEFDSPIESRLMSKALSVEPLVHGSGAKNYSAAETWSILGESLLSGDPLEMSVCQAVNPLKSAIWASALRRRLTTVPVGMRSRLHDRYESMLNYEDACRSQETTMLLNSLQ